MSAGEFMVEQSVVEALISAVRFIFKECVNAPTAKRAGRRKRRTANRPLLTFLSPSFGLRPCGFSLFSSYFF